MTVAELMEKLSQFDLDMVVTTGDYYDEDHYPITRVEELQACQQYPDGMMQKHREEHEGCENLVLYVRVV